MFTLLDTIDWAKKNQVIKLKWIEDIDLLKLFPTVIEPLILDYVHDIINVDIIHSNRTSIVTISIEDQCINFNNISFDFTIRDALAKKDMYVHIEYIDNSIATIVCNTYSNIGTIKLMNKFLRVCCKQHPELLFDEDILAQYSYQPILHTVKFRKNVLSYFAVYDDYSDTYYQTKIKITNRDLFTKLIMIIKIMYDHFHQKN